MLREYKYPPTLPLSYLTTRHDITKTTIPTFVHDSTQKYSRQVPHASSTHQWDPFASVAIQENVSFRLPCTFIYLSDALSLGV